MSRFWSPIVHQLDPYVPGEQPKVANLVKLNTNENPYGPSPKALAAIQGVIDDSLRLYPDPDAGDLKQAIADYYQVKKQQVFVGNGSDEVLAHIFHGLFQQSAPILFPDISYSFYPVYCSLYQIDFDLIPLSEDLTINTADYIRDNGGIIFPNPNAPTGRLLSLEDIDALLKQNGHSVVVVDEAYIDFGGETAIKLVDRYPNLLVTQTLSKSRSLAGLRIGFAIGHVDLIEALIRIKDSFNSYPIDRVSIAAGIASFEDKAYFDHTCQRVIENRNNVVAQLEAMGFTVLPSAANFILTRHADHSALTLVAGLREQGVIVRHFKQERIAQYLRITIGNEQENSQLLTALKDLITT